jgi:hypothetical protein
LRFALTGSRSDGFPIAGLGLPPIAAADDIGNARRGSFRDNEELADDADLGLPTRGERMWSLYLRKRTVHAVTEYEDAVRP